MSSLLRVFAGLSLALGAAVPAFAQAPSNDHPTGATFIVDPALIAGDTTGSVVDGPAPSCAIASADVWYRYFATFSGTATATVCPTAGLGGGSPGTLSDSVIAVFEDLGPVPGGGPGLELACNDDGCTSGTAQSASTTMFTVTAGGSYLISVSGAGGVRGTFTLECSTAPCPPPPCDGLGSPCPVVIGTVTGSNACATPGAYGSEDVFISFTVVGPKQILISNTILTTFTPAVGVFDNLGPGLGATPETSSTLAPTGSITYKINDCLTHTITIGIRTAAGTGGAYAFNISLKYLFKITKPNGGDSLKIESHDGPPGAVAFMAVTLDILHPGLATGVTFPNGWWFGVPLGFAEFAAEVNFPGGLPFLTVLDQTGAATHLDLPAGSTAAFAGAKLWLVGAAFDPATGFSTISATTDPTEEIL